jgi:hypothetical protein
LTIRSLASARRFNELDDRKKPEGNFGKAAELKN